MTLFRGVIRAMAFPLAVWPEGRALLAVVARTTSEAVTGRLYQSGRVDRLRINAVIVYDDELLDSSGAHFPLDLPPRAWRVAANASARTRLERWLEDATALRAYRSDDGAITLADRVWGGHVACEPALAVG